MDKVLIVGRHGMAPFLADEIRDIDRTLNEDGILETYDMAELIKKKKISPDKIITSQAVRAIHTSQIYQRVFKLDFSQIEMVEDVYSNDVKQLLSLIHSQPNEIDTLMIVGHNPAISHVSYHFAQLPEVQMDPSGVTIIKFDVDRWDSIDIGLMKQAKHYCPENDL